MEKYAWKATIKEGSLEEYIRRHDNLPQEMKEVLREAGICNYTIWNVGNQLFGYYVRSRARRQGAEGKPGR